MHPILTKKVIYILSAVLVLSLAVLACGFPGAAGPAVITVVVTRFSTSDPASSIATSGNVVPVNPATGQPPSSPIQVPQTPTVTHINRPGLPPGSAAHIGDPDSSITAAQHYPPAGDYFEINLFERPFNAGTQDTYFPQVDILQTSMVNGSPWVYGSVTLKGPEPVTNLLNAAYALELDLDMDGRGDVLLVANNPIQGEWSTNGVQVFLDPNRDVGANVPLYTEVMPQGNGYEQKVFDSGQGTDPDMAWARVVPGQPNVVWFAFKSTLINTTDKWMWRAWAQHSGLHPELADYNDHFTLVQAGNPMPGNSNYPLKALAEVDNTCRWVIGFTPTGSEPGLCPIAAPPVPATSVPATDVAGTGGADFKPGYQYPCAVCHIETALYCDACSDNRQIPGEILTHTCVKGTQPRLYRNSYAIRINHIPGAWHKPYSSRTTFSALSWGSPRPVSISIHPVISMGRFELSAGRACR